MKNYIRNAIIKLMPYELLSRYINKRNFSHSSIIYNIGRNAQPQKKVLVSYVNDYLHIKEWETQKSTRNVECAEIVSAFLSRNCSVDLCTNNRIDGIREDYDIVFGFGDAYRKAIELNPKAQKILYLTEKPPFYSYHKEEERIAQLYHRHGIKAPLSRSGLYFREEDVQNCDICLMIGQESDRALLENKNVYTVYPTGLYNRKFMLEDDEEELCDRTHFLWLGSRGAIHKGLDLLLDVFANHPELTLHVAGLNALDKKTLSPIIPSNVVDHGFVNIDSELFLNIAHCCSCIVSASCSEAVPTSIITGMNHGLIPLVSQECSMPVGSIGEIFKDNSIDTIEQAIIRWSKKDTIELVKQKRQVQTYAMQEFDISRFALSINGFVKSILSLS